MTLTLDQQVYGKGDTATASYSVAGTTGADTVAFAAPTTNGLTFTVTADPKIWVATVTTDFGYTITGHVNVDGSLFTPAVVVNDGWVHGAPGTYEPDRSTTGYSAAGTPTLTPYSGDYIVTVANTVLRGLDISGRVLVRAANCTVDTCKVRGNGAPQTSTALVDGNHPAATGLVVKDSDLIPDTPALGMDGIDGHHYQSIRNYIIHTTDGLGCFSTVSGGSVNMYTLATYVAWLTYWNPDSGHSDGHSHNDAIQLQGCSNAGSSTIVIRWNSLHATIWAGQNYTLDPYYPNATGQVITGSPQSGTDRSVRGLTVSYNWLHGGSRTCVFITAGVAIVAPLGTFTYNVLDNTPQANGGEAAHFPTIGCQIDQTGGLSWSSYTGNVWTQGGTAALSNGTG